MIEISLTDFVDFVVKSGTAKLTTVRRIKARGEYEPKHDFWKPLRQGIVNFHKEGGKDKQFLDDLCKRLYDRKKIVRYPEAIQGYKKFLGRKSISWFDPPKSSWAKSDLIVRVNPELGLTIDGQRYIIKLYFKDEELQKRKSHVVLALMQNALSYESDDKLAILDVALGKLCTTSGDLSQCFPLLAGEAASFATIWQELPNS